jgi:hypothetical protein
MVVNASADRRSTDPSSNKCLCLGSKPDVAFVTARAIERDQYSNIAITPVQLSPSDRASGSARVAPRHKKALRRPRRSIRP